MSPLDKLGFPELTLEVKCLGGCSFCFIVVVVCLIVNLFYRMIVSTSLCQRQSLQVPCFGFHEAVGALAS